MVFRGRRKAAALLRRLCVSANSCGFRWYPGTPLSPLEGASNELQKEAPPVSDLLLIAGLVRKCCAEAEGHDLMSRVLGFRLGVCLKHSLRNLKGVWGLEVQGLRLAIGWEMFS